MPKAQGSALLTGARGVQTEGSTCRGGRRVTGVHSRHLSSEPSTEAAHSHSRRYTRKVPTAPLGSGFGGGLQIITNSVAMQLSQHQTLRFITNSLMPLKGQKPGSHMEHRRWKKVTPS